MHGLSIGEHRLKSIECPYFLGTSASCSSALLPLAHVAVPYCLAFDFVLRLSRVGHALERQDFLRAHCAFSLVATEIFRPLPLLGSLLLENYARRFTFVELVRELLLIHADGVQLLVDLTIVGWSDFLKLHDIVGCDIVVGIAGVSQEAVDRRHAVNHHSFSLVHHNVRLSLENGPRSIPVQLLVGCVIGSITANVVPTDFLLDHVSHPVVIILAARFEMLIIDVLLEL